MINPCRHASAFWAPMVVILFGATATYSQAPTDAQRSAIRAQCRADYQAHCASIPPGGKASLQCLQQNMSSLSSGCQAAVHAVEAPAAPKAESAPTAPAASAPAAATAKPNPETKRVPQRLSAKLRRRADRRPRGIELSGKEQGEPLGQLSESGQRRCV